MLLIQIYQNYIIPSTRQQIPNLINYHDVFATDIQTTYLTPLATPLQANPSHQPCHSKIVCLSGVENTVYLTRLSERVAAIVTLHVTNHYSCKTWNMCCLATPRYRAFARGSRIPMITACFDEAVFRRVVVVDVSTPSKAYLMFLHSRPLR